MLSPGWEVVRLCDVGCYPVFRLELGLVPGSWCPWPLVWVLPATIAEVEALKLLVGKGAKIDGDGEFHVGVWHSKI